MPSARSDRGFSSSPDLFISELTGGRGETQRERHTKEQGVREGGEREGGVRAGGEREGGKRER
jgi:hypothetical protein